MFPITAAKIESDGSNSISVEFHYFGIGHFIPQLDDTYEARPQLGENRLKIGAIEALKGSRNYRSSHHVHRDCVDGEQVIIDSKILWREVLIRNEGESRVYDVEMGIEYTRPISHLKPGYIGLLIPLAGEPLSRNHKALKTLYATYDCYR